MREGPWKCFHCDYVATTEVEAREHFGPNTFHPAVCTMLKVFEGADNAVYTPVEACMIIDCLKVMQANELLMGNMPSVRGLGMTIDLFIMMADHIWGEDFRETMLK